jgi:transcriptional regulator with XRE-family HTH domain
VTKDAALSFNNDDRYRNIGYAISYFRKRKGLTQEEVAERVGISRQHLGSIEAPNMVRALSLESANKKSSP